MRSIWISAVLLVLQLSHAKAADAPQPDAERAKQEAVYQSRGENVPSGYVVDRSLLSYASTLLPGFDRALADLGPGDRWLDIGAGQGRAILDYYGARFDAMHAEGRERRGKKAQAVAMSIEDRRTPQWQETAAQLEAGQIRYLSGRRLREYPAEELGRFQLVTDLVGGFSYSRALSVFMEKVLGALEVNGRFYTILLDVLPETAPDRTRYPDIRLLTAIAGSGGSEVTVCSWLKRIRCAETVCESRMESNRPVELYRVRKVCEDVAVPALEVTQYEAGTPPVRRFQLKP
jgi:SAM-dependent methyltransferase